MNYKITFKLSTVDRELFWVYDFNPGLKSNKNHMQVTKCDICKKEIKGYKNEIGVRPPTGFVNFVFCLKCGKPLLKFLEKHNLGEKTNK